MIRCDYLNQDGNYFLSASLLAQGAWSEWEISVGSSLKGLILCLLMKEFPLRTSPLDSQSCMMGNTNSPCGSVGTINGCVNFLLLLQQIITNWFRTTYTLSVMAVRGLKPRYQQDCSFWKLQERIQFLHSLACGPFLPLLHPPASVITSPTTWSCLLL